MTGMFAYVGPGAGFTVLGSAFLFLAVALLVTIGLVWYPVAVLRRAIAKRIGRSRPRETDG